MVLSGVTALGDSSTWRLNIAPRNAILWATNELYFTESRTATPRLVVRGDSTEGRERKVEK